MYVWWFGMLYVPELLKSVTSKEPAEERSCNGVAMAPAAANVPARVVVKRMMVESFEQF